MKDKISEIEKLMTEFNAKHSVDVTTRPKKRKKRLTYYKAEHPEYGTWFFTTKTKLAVILRLKSPYIYAKYKRAYINYDPKTGFERHYINGWVVEELHFSPEAPISQLDPSYDRVYDIEKWREDDYKEKHPLYCYEAAI